MYCPSNVFHSARDEIHALICRDEGLLYVPRIRYGHVKVLRLLLHVIPNSKNIVLNFTNIELGFCGNVGLRTFCESSGE